MKPIIKVENLSKQYRLGSIGTGTISNDLKRWWYKTRGKEDPFLKIGETNDRTTKGNSEYAWALKDINFEVMPGEVLGIIGKNGAGKSTLLKILSKVTGPTTGRIDYNGRIGSLLEVGTGFHPELTGRENIFLNGAILGMTKHEIRSKLDEIIDFSGCERYIDTPVKRYSSGMTVRLGFAVAAHLEPEILVVDEVLAVGDAEFQKKAIGKMQDVSRNDGRTVLFVSHNMAAMKKLCTSGIILKNGTVSYQDKNIINVIECYTKNNISYTALPIKLRPDRQGNQIVKIQNLDIIGLNNSSELQNDMPLKIVIQYTSKENIHFFKIYISINDINDQTVTFMDSSTIDVPININRTGQITIELDSNFALSSGQYHLNIAFLVNGDIADYITQALVFTIVDGAFFSNGKIPIGNGICHVKQNWIFE